MSLPEVLFTVDRSTSSFDQPTEGRFSGGVDIPDPCATAHLPAAIVGFEVGPPVDGSQRADRGRCARTS
jgi:formamidase